MPWAALNGVNQRRLPPQIISSGGEREGKSHVFIRAQIALEKSA